MALSILSSRYFSFRLSDISMVVLSSFLFLSSCKAESNTSVEPDLLSMSEENLVENIPTITTSIDIEESDQETIINTDDKGSILLITTFKFTDKLIYKFKTNISGYGNFYEGEGDQEGEIVIYVEPKTNTFLFTKEAYGVSGEMIDFVIADTLGNYLFGYTDEFGKNFQENYFIEYVKLSAESKKYVESDFKQYLKPMSERKVFGKKNFPTPTFDAQAYEMTSMKTIDKAKVFLAASFLNLRPLYSFNGLDSETKLPFYFDYNNVIPNRFMPVYDKYKAVEGGVYSEMYLDSYQPTEYFVDLKKYKPIVKNK